MGADSDEGEGKEAYLLWMNTMGTRYLHRENFTTRYACFLKRLSLD